MPANVHKLPAGNYQLTLTGGELELLSLGAVAVHACIEEGPQPAQDILSHGLITSMMIGKSAEQIREASTAIQNKIKLLIDHLNQR